MLKEQDKTMSKFTEYLENNSSIITEAKTSSTTNLTKALLWGSRNLIKISISSFLIVSGGKNLKTLIFVQFIIRPSS